MRAAWRFKRSYEDASKWNGRQLPVRCRVIANHVRLLRNKGYRGRRMTGDWKFQHWLSAAALLCLASVALSAPARTLSVGFEHACETSVAGVLRCWGGNSGGQTGGSIGQDRLSPGVIEGLEPEVRTVATGLSHSCAVTRQGGAWCWGLNNAGQLGDGTLTSRATPAGVEGLASAVVSIAATNLSTCALTESGGVKCWGSNWRGQLGNGTTADSSLPVDVTGLSGGVVEIGMGSFHACALTQAGAVYCWGSNNGGALGNGGIEDSSIPVAVSGLDTGVTSIEINSSGSCAVLADGSVKCWGGTYLIPEPVPFLDTAVAQLAIGHAHRCALKKDGQVLCWGENDLGQLGDGTEQTSAKPRIVSGLSEGIVEIASSWDFTCAKSETGLVQCWGDNVFGQRGDGTRTRHPTPVDVIAVDAPFDRLAAGSNHNCARANGKVYCWGQNDGAVLGEGVGARSDVPLEVVGLEEEVTSVAAGFAYGCASLQSGRAKCWGMSPVGQMSSADVPGLKPTVREVVGGPLALHACAISASGALSCWGRNDFGELGDGTTTESSSAVAVVGLDSGVAAATAGVMHTCALTGSGGVKCWGRNDSGQLGNGSFDASPLPVDVVGLDSGVAAISAGEHHTCAMLTDGSMKCWGGNDEGQLGIGSDSQSHAQPVDVMLFDQSATAIAAGAGHTCATISDGATVCWGANFYGVLGDGTFGSQRQPGSFVVGLAPGTAQVGIGRNHSCALSSMGAIQCWGYNQNGVLGDGRAGSLMPTVVTGSPFDDSVFRDGFETD